MYTYKECTYRKVHAVGGVSMGEGGAWSVCVTCVSKCMHLVEGSGGRKYENDVLLPYYSYFYPIINALM